MQSKSLFLEIVLVGFAFLVGMQGSGSTVGGQDSAGAERRKAVGSGLENKKEISFDLGRGIKIDFVLIPSGSFMMGDEKGIATKNRSTRSPLASLSTWASSR